MRDKELIEMNLSEQERVNGLNLLNILRQSRVDNKALELLFYNKYSLIKNNIAVEMRFTDERIDDFIQSYLNYEYCSNYADMIGVKHNTSAKISYKKIEKEEIYTQLFLIVKKIVDDEKFNLNKYNDELMQLNAVRKYIRGRLENYINDYEHKNYDLQRVMVNGERKMVKFCNENVYIDDLKIFSDISDEEFENIDNLTFADITSDDKFVIDEVEENLNFVHTRGKYYRDLVSDYIHTHYREVLTRKQVENIDKLKQATLDGINIYNWKDINGGLNYTEAGKILFSKRKDNNVRKDIVNMLNSMNSRMLKAIEKDEKINEFYKNNYKSKDENKIEKVDKLTQEQKENLRRKRYLNLFELVALNNTTN